MATTPTSMPPTTHALPPAHRLRLMRSTRKLGAVLGETPLLVDAAPDSAPHTHGHGQPRLYLPTAPPRTSSLRRAALPLAPRPLLVIDVPPAPALAARRDSLSLLTPDLFSSPPPSPLSPTPAATAGTDAARRRKLAKLARTLGENVPPALVFGPADAPAGRRRRRASTLSVPAPERRSRASFSSAHSSDREHLLAADMRRRE